MKGLFAEKSKEAGGFTLVEVMVVVGIMASTVGLVGSGIFQTLYTDTTWRDDVVATKEWRHAGSWFAGDALNAQSTDLVDGGPPANSVTLTWTDSEGTLHTATYSLSGSRLIRDFDGAQITLAKKVVAVGFYLSSKTLTFDLEVQAEKEGTETARLQTYLRMLEQ